MINITPVVKTRVKQMILDLMPEVGYVKVSNSGIVTLKSKWYSTKSIKTTVTDLLVGVIPEKISEHTVNSGNSINYLSAFNKRIAMIMSMRAYSQTFDICDYVWTEYSKYCVTVPEIIINTNKELLFLKKSNYLPAKSPFSSIKVMELVKNIKQENTTLTKRFKKSLDRMKNNLPIPHVTVFGHNFGGTRQVIITT